MHSANEIRVESMISTFFDEIHVDEKWFNMTEDGVCCLCALDEEPPHRTCQSKRFIKKIMFLCAMAKPQQFPNGTWPDGKIGTWTIGYQSQFQRTTKNHRKDDPKWETKIVDQDEYQWMLIYHLLLAIVERFPMDYLTKKGVKVQQDSQSTHP